MLPRSRRVFPKPLSLGVFSRLFDASRSLLRRALLTVTLTSHRLLAWPDTKSSRTTSTTTTLLPCQRHPLEHSLDLRSPRDTSRTSILPQHPPLEAANRRSDRRALRLLDRRRRRGKLRYVDLSLSLFSSLRILASLRSSHLQRVLVFLVSSLQSHTADPEGTILEQAKLIESLRKQLTKEKSEHQETKGELDVSQKKVSTDSLLVVRCLLLSLTQSSVLPFLQITRLEKSFSDVEHDVRLSLFIHPSSARPRARI